MTAAQTRRWRAEHPEASRAADERSNAKRVLRYGTDPAYRALVAARGKARYERRRAAGVSVHKIVAQPEFLALFDAQGGVCAICRLPETAKDPSGRTKRLAVDHDAATGRVRGLLCARCNTAIGLLQHDAERTRAALDYLARDGES